MASSPPRRAVVLGGGLTGMLTAAALATSVDIGTVTIVERFELPDTPRSRQGLPQARHAHLLWSGGARAMDTLLPGVQKELLAAGGRRLPMPEGIVTMSAQGWLRRFLGGDQFVITCSRDLLDWVIRRRVLALPGVVLLERTTPGRLVGAVDRVTGVTVTDRGGRETTLEADLVVDASGGIGSRAPEWLERLGLPEIREESLDSGLAYASRLYRTPAGAEGLPLVNVQSNPGDRVPGQTATILPIENGQWLVTLSGTRGGEPTGERDAFLPFARGVRHPIVAELLEHAAPVTGEISTNHGSLNRRRFFEQAPYWPEGFVVIGDAVATFNPVYGQGMSVAAQGALALRKRLTDTTLHKQGFARAVQRDIAGPVSAAWDLATGQDILYPDVRTTLTHSAADRGLGRCVDRLIRTSTGDRNVSRAFLDVMSLNAPIGSLAKPRIVAAVIRGPRLPALTSPPLTTAELAFTTRTNEEDASPERPAV